MTLTATRWAEICHYDDLLPERGECALVGGQQVAIFRTHDGRLFALHNRDPFSGAYVLARGIVGSRGGYATVASPMYKQVFDLATGRCLDDADVSVPTFRIRLDGTRVEVAEP
ncbi:nitrite reductase small subunit NirD [Actinomadura sp. HBU206391]|uniref:nitrite reductase small subunit NirD n=1 Tax=Actinomadura sp. HBU206391 TaxID=2731692 RepID=UPI00164FC442|nr:nitrite reductase small subunit NirD [Actinomadura sp. HBU206391]MBC6459382.1 nitrite reductase small subunit NirD [Actinomadura sp. HBU206391]